MKVVLVLCCFIGLAQSFLFWGSSGSQRAEGPVASTCENRGKKGECGFYTCFDTRHPCSQHNWALSYGWRYCNRFDQEYRRFTAEAKHWINNTRTCVMDKLLTYYRLDSINCEDLEHDMKREHANCEEQYGVCNVEMLMDNREILMDVYKVSRRGTVRFLTFLKQCGGTQLQEFVSFLGDQAGNFDVVIDKFKGIFQRK